MTITWGRLRRRKDRNEQAAGTGADERGSRASEKLEKLRERQEAQLEARRELSGGCKDPRLPGTSNIPSGPGW
jgi:hypothetical protein